MFSDKGLIRLTYMMMAAGLGGTLAVLAHVLPAPELTPPNPSLSAFENAFVGKDWLLTSYQWIRLHVFHSVPPSVVLGQNGWLYYHSEATGDGYTLNDFMGRTMPDTVTLSRWKQTIIDRRQNLQHKGIKYLVFVAPNTTSIYPENLPNEILKAQKPTRLDSVMAIMNDEIMDLRPFLLQRKQIEDVYEVSDTHWNDLGAFAAYEAVTAKLVAWFPDIRPVQRSDLSTQHPFRLREVESIAGRWIAWEPKPTSNLLPTKTFDARCADNNKAVLAPGSSATFHDWVWDATECPSRRFIQDHRSLPKALVFHDSYLMALNGFLSQNFREVRYVRARFDPSIVDLEKPDIVIEEVAERYLDQIF